MYCSSSPSTSTPTSPKSTRHGRLRCWSSAIANSTTTDDNSNIYDIFDNAELGHLEVTSDAPPSPREHETAVSPLGSLDEGGGLGGDCREGTTLEDGPGVHLQRCRLVSGLVPCEALAEGKASELWIGAPSWLVVGSVANRIGSQAETSNSRSTEVPGRAPSRGLPRPPPHCSLQWALAAASPNRHRTLVADSLLVHCAPGLPGLPGDRSCGSRPPEPHAADGYKRASILRGAHFVATFSPVRRPLVQLDPRGRRFLQRHLRWTAVLHFGRPAQPEGSTCPYGSSRSLST